MTTQEVKRKLTAILSADAKGYSRLLGEDELGTIRTLNAHKEIMANLIQQHRGRVVDAPGDNLLAEFGSVVDAVHCAVEIQKELKIKNSELQENRRMEFRIGVNLGDVVEEKDKIFGDGVNIAARLESLAEAGGVCISGIAFDQVRNKLNLGYEFRGEQTVKNIAEPVRVYKVLMEPEAAGKVIGEKKVKPKQWQRATIGLIVAVIVVAAAVVIWKLYTPSVPQPEVASKEKIPTPQPEKPSATLPSEPAPSVETAPKEKVMPPLPKKISKPVTPPSPKEEVASKEKMAFPLPDVPSIAVLPFVNMSGDPKQEFFSDGMTEEIITALSKLPGLFVIARTSTSTYKGKPVKVKQVSEELGVRYVLEGSVQRSGDRVRITAQLIDALTGHHLWAERYDRDLKDIFALQDEITIKILRAIQVKLEGGDVSGFEKFAEKYYRGKQGLDCYLKATQAMGYMQRFNRADNNLARRMIEEAIAICPENPVDYIHLGYVYYFDLVLGNTKSPRETLEKGIEMAQKALAMNDSIPDAHGLLSRLYSSKGEHDKAIAEGERAVALNPSGWGVLTNYGNSLTYAGRPEEAIPLLQKVIRLNPFGPAYIYSNLGRALGMTGRFEESVSAYKKAIQLAPDNIPYHAELVVTYSMMGREEKARAEAAEVLRINPKYSLDHFEQTVLRSYKDPSVRLKIINAMRKAGLK
jgi:adenylate cyclase